MTFVIYIVAHVGAPPSPCDHFSIYILLYFILLYATIHELMEIKLIKSNQKVYTLFNWQYKIGFDKQKLLFVKSCFIVSIVYCILM